MNPNHSNRDGLLTLRRCWSIGGIAAIALFAIAWYALGVRPASMDLDNTRAATDATFNFLNTGQVVHQQVFAAQSRQQDVDLRFLSAKQRSDRAKDEIAFLSWIGEHARAATLELNDYRPLGVSEYQDYQGRILQFAGRGSYAAVCRVLDDLRKAPQLNRVTSLSITPIDQTRREFQVALRIELLSMVEPDTQHTASL